jgi:hypothetical protein
MLKSRGTTSVAASVHLGTSLRYVHQVPKCHKVVHLGLDHVGAQASTTHPLLGEHHLSIITTWHFFCCALLCILIVVKTSSLPREVNNICKRDYVSVA